MHTLATLPLFAAACLHACMAAAGSSLLPACNTALGQEVLGHVLALAARTRTRLALPAWVACLAGIYCTYHLLHALSHATAWLATTLPHICLLCSPCLPACQNSPLLLHWLLAWHFYPPHLPATMPPHAFPLPAAPCACALCLLGDRALAGMHTPRKHTTSFPS